jgi:hypothetical protein
MSEELDRLIEEARSRPPMTAAEREEQARSFAAGNVGIENPDVTREVVDQAAAAETERLAHMALEMDFWAGCRNTFGEETKQLLYLRKMGFALSPTWRSNFAFDAKGRSFIDFGGGPVSVLLKFDNLGMSTVVDPAPWPDWVRARYAASNIDLLSIAAEDYSLMHQPHDVALVYNCLQHVSDPEKIVKNALASAKELKLFEWIDTPPHPGHPHTIRAADLERWTGKKGTTVQLNGESECTGRAWYL